MRQNISINVWLNSVNFINSNTGFTAGTLTNTVFSSAVVLKTTNGGINWNSLELGGSYYWLYSVYFNNLFTGYVAGENVILKTTNGGINWYHQLTQNVNIYDCIAFTDINTGYVLGDLGVILKTTDGGGPIGISPISTEIPFEYKLYQNYPNPFNPSTTIEYSLPRAGHVRVTVHNVIGQQLSCLVDEYQGVGVHQVKWSPTGLPSGIYFCTLDYATSSIRERLIYIK